MEKAEEIKEKQNANENTDKKVYVKPEIRQIKRVVACGGHKIWLFRPTFEVWGIIPWITYPMTMILDVFLVYLR